jgi:hypothetical protein
MVWDWNGRIRKVTSLRLMYLLISRSHPVRLVHGISLVSVVVAVVEETIITVNNVKRKMVHPRLNEPSKDKVHIFVPTKRMTQDVGHICVEAS